MYFSSEAFYLSQPISEYYTETVNTGGLLEKTALSASEPEQSTSGSALISPVQSGAVGDSQLFADVPFHRLSDELDNDSCHLDEINDYIAGNSKNYVVAMMHPNVSLKSVKALLKYANSGGQEVTLGDATTSAYGAFEPHGRNQADAVPNSQLCRNSSDDLSKYVRRESGGQSQSFEMDSTGVDDVQDLSAQLSSFARTDSSSFESTVDQTDDVHGMPRQTQSMLSNFFTVPDAVTDRRLVQDHAATRNTLDEASPKRKRESRRIPACTPVKRRNVAAVVSSSSENHLPNKKCDSAAQLNARLSAMPGSSTTSPTIIATTGAQSLVNQPIADLASYLGACPSTGSPLMCRKSNVLKLCNISSARSYYVTSSRQNATPPESSSNTVNVLRIIKSTPSTSGQRTLSVANLNPFNSRQLACKSSQRISIVKKFQPESGTLMRTELTGNSTTDKQNGSLPTNANADVSSDKTRKLSTASSSLSYPAVRTYDKRVPVGPLRRRTGSEAPYYLYLDRLWLKQVLPNMETTDRGASWRCPICVSNGRKMTPMGITDRVRKDGCLISKEEGARKSFVKHVQRYHFEEVCRKVFPEGAAPEHAWPRSIRRLKKSADPAV